MAKNYFEVIIKINPEAAEIASDVLFSNFDCDGVVTAEEEYKDLELISCRNNVVKGFVINENITPDEIKTVIKNAYNELLENGCKADFLGGWDVEVKEVVNEDWSKKWKENWQPTKVSDKITISPQWIDYVPQENEMVINIDPGAAFGTGTHATTQLCILAMEKYLTKNASVADIGTGSGILAIVASKLGAKSVIGVDNDPDAIEASLENAKINDVKNCNFEIGEVSLLQGNEYDFVVANILHNVLAEIMGELKGIMKVGGKLVLSGILNTKADVVHEAIKKHGLKTIAVDELNQWVAITVEK